MNSVAPCARLSGAAANIWHNLWWVGSGMKHMMTAALVSTLLGACGGGGTHITPRVTDAQVSMQYGKAASITLVGQYFDSGMTAETGSCTNPVFAASSTTERAVLTCKVGAPGEVPITVKDSTGTVVYTTTVTVPKPQVTLITNMGAVVMELEPAVVPLTVNNFLAYVTSGFYQNTLFHRVESGFVVQGGGYTTGMVAKSGQLAAIALETNKGLSNTVGTVGMARTEEPDSATSEFYINLADNKNLDYRNSDKPGYAVFGTVVQGVDVVKKIASVQTGPNNGFANVPTEEVTISFAFQSK